MLLAGNTLWAAWRIAVTAARAVRMECSAALRIGGVSLVAQPPKDAWTAAAAVGTGSMTWVTREGSTEESEHLGPSCVGQLAALADSVSLG